ncbi:hypothetical protein QTP88_028097 [Uroleucon formosanum]
MFLEYIDILGPSYSCIKDAAKDSFLPQNTFLELHKLLPVINVSNLQSEYLAFAASFESLEVGITNPEISKISAQQSNNINEDDKIDSESEDVEVSHTNDKQFGFASRMVQIMSSYGLMASLPNLYLAFKVVFTIPASSASVERVFSKVKIIKNRLRTTIGQNRLESLMLLSCEKDISPNLEVLDRMGKSSQLLERALFSSSSWLYDSPRVFATTVKAFHLSLSWTITFQSSTSGVLKSCLTPSNHRFLGLPLGLFPLGWYSMATLTAFDSSLRIVCPNYCSRCALV